MTSEVSAKRSTRFGDWAHALRTCSPLSEDPDALTRWLVVTRACVQPMTLTSVAIGGLLAVGHRGFDPLLFALAAIGLVVAHAANNMINDLFDLEAGLDTSSYPRTLYAPQPVTSGLVTRATLIRAILVANAIDGVVMLVLFAARGWPVIAFALAGLFISVFYVAPPLRLKARGLGEPGVFLVWGPLMIGGLYYAATGDIGRDIVAASIPYALLVTSVLMGKHVDKIEWDAPAGIKTIPVLLGSSRARRATTLLIVSFYVVVVLLVALGVLPVPVLIVVASLPLARRAVRTYSRPTPEQPPPRYPVWPLWYAPWAFVHARRAGALLVVGLLIAALL